MMTLYCRQYMTTRMGWYLNVSILDFIGAKDDGSGGDNWSYKTTQQHRFLCSSLTHPSRLKLNKATTWLMAIRPNGM